MAIPTNEDHDSDPVMYGPNTVYADGLAQLAIAPFVSKLTFGVDRKTGEALIPVQTVVLPTPALIVLATQVLNALNTSALQATFKGELDKYAASLTDGKPISTL